jgi:hypothetical protein
MAISARTIAPVIIPIWPIGAAVVRRRRLDGARVRAGHVGGVGRAQVRGLRDEAGVAGVGRAQVLAGGHDHGTRGVAGIRRARVWPVLTTTAREASTASGERRSVFALAAAGATTVARTAASVAVVLRSAAHQPSRLEPPVCGSSEGACAHR